MRKQRHDGDAVKNCPMEAALDQIGGKWKGAILYRLSEKTLRFNELNRLFRITPRSLTRQLREMEQDGLVRRTVYAQVPPKVEYSLTDKGQSLRPILQALLVWGAQYALPPGEFA